MNTGLEAAVRRRYGKGWALLALVSVLIVNLITLAADLEGGGAALSLLIHEGGLGGKFVVSGAEKI